MLFVLAGLSFASLAFAAATLIVCLRFIGAERSHAASERATHVGMTADLLQRIQAPEMAVVAHSTQQAMEPVSVPVPMDDDIAQWAAQGVEVSKDELADRLFGSGLPA